MPLSPTTLHDAREAMARGEQHFLDRFPGSFLLAIGHLAAHPSESRPLEEPVQGRPTRELRALDLETTLSMSFGDRLKYALQDHPLAGCLFHLPPTNDELTFTVGRKVGCDLTVPDASVSELHCQLLLDRHGQLWVKDMDSTNGTLIDLTRQDQHDPTPINDEQILTVGRYGFQLLHARTLLESLRALSG